MAQLQKSNGDAAEICGSWCGMVSGQWRMESVGSAGGSIDERTSKGEEDAEVTNDETDGPQIPEAERMRATSRRRRRRCWRETKKASSSCVRQAEPAMIIRNDVPAKMVDQIADLFRDQLEAMVTTQRKASARPSPTTCREAAVS